MRIKALATIGLLTLLCAVLSTQAAAQAGTEKRMAGGAKSISGCLIKLDSGFGIKTDDGTYQLNTDRDLSSFVGKQIKIDGTWKASGTFTTAPIGSSTENAPAPPSPRPPGPSSP